MAQYRSKHTGAIIDSSIDTVIAGITGSSGTSGTSGVNASDNKFQRSGSIITFVNQGDTLNLSSSYDNALIVNNGRVLTNIHTITAATGITDPAIWSYPGDGTAIVTNTDTGVRLYNNNYYSGSIDRYILSPITASFLPYVMNYVVGDYNNGNPIMRVTQDVNEINESDIVPILTVYRSGNTLFKTDWDGIGRGLANRLHQRFIKTQRYGRESGITLSVSGSSRVAQITSGAFWIGALRLSSSAFKSDINEMKLLYTSASSIKTSLITQLDNYHYDTGAGTASLGGSTRYAVNWVYKTADSEINTAYVLLGTDNYTETEAIYSQPPPLGNTIATTHVLVGRAIFQRSATTPSQVDSAWDTRYNPSSVANHNNLTNIQGGQVDEYYHLTHNEYSGSGTGTFLRASGPEITGNLIVSGTTTLSGSLILVGEPTGTIIMTSPDSSRWRVWIDNNGYFSSSKIL